jgi:hypothetical protein
LIARQLDFGLFYFIIIMRAIFDQSARLEESEEIHVYVNSFNEIFIGNRDIEQPICCVFSPDEAMLFAKEVIRIAKQIKNTHI